MWQTQRDGYTLAVEPAGVGFRGHNRELPLGLNDALDDKAAAPIVAALERCDAAQGWEERTEPSSIARLLAYCAAGDEAEQEAVRERIAAARISPGRRALHMLRSWRLEELLGGQR